MAIKLSDTHTVFYDTLWNSSIFLEIFLSLLLLILSGNCQMKWERKLYDRLLSTEI